jgi:tRNA (mo5U34)-methyltransferase
VLGIDIDPRYLAPARWAAERFGLPNVRFARRQVYDLDPAERFDLILFMGVFYHLRYPMLALDLLARLRPRLMVFQTLTQGSLEVCAQTSEDCDFTTRERLARPDWPNLAFVESTFCGDPTNWWVPNRAAVLGMLRAAGFDIIDHPGDETWLCTSAAAPSVGQDPATFDAARALARGLTAMENSR